jgi:DNA polymerase-3 subunit epsilon
MREIVLDTETTGLDPLTGDRLVEIGCIELANHIPTGRIWHKYFNPERDMPDAAYRVHGLSEEFLSDKPLFAELADEFLEFIAGARLVIHNADFDTGFLNAELARIDRPPLQGDLVLDTLAMARRKHPAAGNSLDALCRRYGIDNSARTRHGALLDAELLAEVYLELLGGRQARLTLTELESGQPALAAAARPATRPHPLPPRIGADEAAAHREAVEALGANAIWSRYSGK